MITRNWHGRTSLENAEYYLQFLLTSGTKGFLRTKGNLSVKIWQQKAKDCCHFWTITEWIDIEAIKLFTGDDYEQAVYYTEDTGMLLEFEEKVNHYESYSVS